MNLEQRVAELELSLAKERSRRKWSAGVAVLGCAVVAAACMGAVQKPKPTDTIDTKMLRLFDDKGHLRAFLAASPKGNVALTLLDQHEKVCAVLGVTSDACPSLELSHSDNSLRARMALAEDGHAALEFYDAEGNIIRAPAAK